jgi:hypothetical protein
MAGGEGAATSGLTDISTSPDNSRVIAEPKPPLITAFVIWQGLDMHG